MRFFTCTYQGKLVGLPFPFEHLLELYLAVEIVLEGFFPPRCDDDDVLDARGYELFDNVGDARLHADRQEFLGNGLGDRKKARAVTGGDNDPFHGVDSSAPAANRQGGVRLVEPTIGHLQGCRHLLEAGLAAAAECHAGRNGVADDSRRPICGRRVLDGGDA